MSARPVRNKTTNSRGRGRGRGSQTAGRGGQSSPGPGPSGLGSSQTPPGHSTSRGGLTPPFRTRGGRIPIPSVLLSQEEFILDNGRGRNQQRSRELVFSSDDDSDYEGGVVQRNGRVRDGAADQGQHAGVGASDQGVSGSGRAVGSRLAAESVWAKEGKLLKPSLQTFLQNL